MSAMNVRSEPKEGITVHCRRVAAWSMFLGCALAAASARGADIRVNSNSAAVANDGLCTLPEAVTAVNFGRSSGSAANECPAGDGNADRIILPSSVQTYTLTNNLTIFRSVSLEGAGTASSFIKSTAQRAIDVKDLDAVSVGPDVIIKNLTIQNGRASGDNSIMSGLYLDARFGAPTVRLDTVNIDGCLNGIRVEGAGDGAGVLTASRLTISSSRSDGLVCRGCGVTLDLSRVTGSKGRAITVDAYLNGSARMASSLMFQNGSIDGNGSSGVNGGGIAGLGGVQANLNVFSSSVTGNTGADGGGIYSQGTGLNLNTATVAKNTAARGGGIFYGAAPADTSTSEFIVRWSTIALNAASNHGGGIHTSTGRNARLDGVLIASNADSGAAPKSPDCLGSVRNENDPTSMMGDTTGCQDVSGTAPVMVATGNMNLAADVIPAGFGNGVKLLGFGQTSPAWQGVFLDSFPALIDIRGMQRPEPFVYNDGTVSSGLMYDVGAFELTQTWPSRLLNVAAQSNDPYVADGEYFDFKPNATGDFITFAVPLVESGTYDFTGWVRTRSTGGIYAAEVASSIGGSYTLLSSKDLYSSSQAKTSWTGVLTVATPGLYYVRFRVTGKNGASSGRELDLSSLNFVKR